MCNICSACGLGCFSLPLRNPVASCVSSSSAKLAAWLALQAYGTMPWDAYRRWPPPYWTSDRAPLACLAWKLSRYDLQGPVRICCLSAQGHVCAGTGAEQDAAALQALTPPAQQPQQEGAKAALCRWQKLAEGEGLELVHPHSVSHVTWHARGDYFASVAPAGNTQVTLAASYFFSVFERHRHRQSTASSVPIVRQPLTDLFVMRCLCSISHLDQQSGGT